MTAVLDRPEIAVEASALDTRDPYDKLADLIEQGSALVPQCTKEYWVCDSNGSVVAACAFGSAMLALGIDNPDKALVEIGFSGGDPIISLIVQRNDIAGQTREEIAAWVRTLKGAH